MSNEIVKAESQVPDILAELQQTEKVVKALMATKHYAKMGAEGIYAIVQKAKSMGIDQMDALNGGIYFVSGKTEMSAQMMNRLIRSKGHSIKKDPKSTNELCILHGTRADNQDTWTCTFSLDDAKRAGIFRQGGTWDKYPAAMTFSRALSMLARQLFPDIIVDCFAEGEIRDAGPLDATVVEVGCISGAERDQLHELLTHDEDPAEATEVILKRLKIESLDDLKTDRFQAMMTWLSKRIADQNTVEAEVVVVGKDESIVEVTEKLLANSEK